MNRKSTVILLIVVGLLVFGGSAFGQAPYDTLSIYDLQWVPNPDSSDLSRFNGDTVVVQGLVMNYPRDLWVGARWAVYIVDPDSFPNPWSGFFIIQHDTFATQTLFGFVEPGMMVNFTGVVDEFSNFSQVFLLTDPAVPIEIVSQNNPLPGPVTLTTDELSSRATAEQWESMWARVEDATVVNNNVPGNWASITDPSGGQSFLAEYFNWFRDRLQAGTYSWPANGTNLNVNGFTRDESGTPGQVYTVNPRDTNDIEILTNPPVITDVERNPGVPTSSDDVNVSAAIVDNGTVDLAQVHYSINWGSFQQATMTATQADTFQGTIPSQSDGDFVRYFVSATDNDGESSTIPGDTSLATGRVFFYTIRDAGLSISDVQNTYGYAADNSGYEGYEVTLQGVVMTDSTDFVGDYWIQDADTAWSGIWVNNDPNTYIKGDMVEVTGTVEENFNVTRLDDITGSQVMTPGAGVFSAVPLNTGDINTGGPLAENFESVLVKVSNLTVTDPFPDDPSNFGEFTVDDGSGGLRVDDFASAFSGNLDSTYGLGDQIDSIVALHYYSFGDYKLIPRDSLDIHGHVVGIGDEITQIPSEFELFQNYPNPFNPSTKIRFNIAKTGQYKLAVFNVLGQKVRTLSNQTFTTGQHEVQWNGRDEFGNQVGSGIYFYRLTGENIALSKKMILLK